MKGIWWAAICVVLAGSSALAQGTAVTVRAVIVDGHRHTAEGVVVWLTPLDPAAPAPHWPQQRFRLTQRNKSFEPHLLIVPVGAVVQFPNRDPFFHNVFSLFEGKRFDLGLYEAGTTRDVRFDKPGISYIFCNIHAQMSAVVIALATPYYGVSNRRGTIMIANVPPGQYAMEVWYESATPETLKALARNVTITDADRALGVLRVEAANLPETHKNKYGRDYDPPEPTSPIYEQP